MVRIVIELRDDGTINVDGPVLNKLLCFGILEMAKKVVADHEPAQVPRVVPVPALNLVPGKR